MVILEARFAIPRLVVVEEEGGELEEEEDAVDLCVPVEPLSFVIGRDIMTKGSGCVRLHPHS